MGEQSGNGAWVYESAGRLLYEQERTTPVWWGRLPEESRESWRNEAKLRLSQQDLAGQNQRLKLELEDEKERLTVLRADFLSRAAQFRRKQYRPEDYEATPGDQILRAMAADAEAQGLYDKPEASATGIGFSEDTTEEQARAHIQAVNVSHDEAKQADRLEIRNDTATKLKVTISPGDAPFYQGLTGEKMSPPRSVPASGARAGTLYDVSERALKIICTGEPWTMKVVDVESGRMIANVVAVKWDARSGEEHSGATIELVDVPVEIQANHPTLKWLSRP